MRGLVLNDPKGFSVDMSQPLAEVLRAVARTRPVWPSEKQLLDFVGGREAVTGDREGAGQWNEQWYRTAWWGYYAARILYRYVISGKIEEVSSIVATPDLTPIHQALAAGRGVILLGNHLGPYPAIDTLSTKFPELNIVTLTSNKARQGPGKLHVTTPEEQKMSLVKSLLHLRKGGIVKIATDGRVVGDSKLFFRFMGKRVRMANGAGELAVLSGAETLWCSATWAAVDQLRLRLAPMPLPTGVSKEETIVKLYRRYLYNMERQMRLSPQDIGFRSGHLLAHRGRLRHYPAEA